MNLKLTLSKSRKSRGERVRYLTEVRCVNRQAYIIVAGGYRYRYTIEWEQWRNSRVMPYPYLTVSHVFEDEIENWEEYE